MEKEFVQVPKIQQLIWFHLFFIYQPETHVVLSSWHVNRCAIFFSQPPTRKQTRRQDGAVSAFQAFLLADDDDIYQVNFQCSWSDNVAFSDNFSFIFLLMTGVIVKTYAADYKVMRICVLYYRMSRRSRRNEPIVRCESLSLLFISTY